MQTVGGFGLVCGPLIGAGLFAAGGFPLTFFVYAAILFLSAPVIFFLYGKDRTYIKEQIEKMSVFAFVTKGRIVMQLLCSMWVGMIMALLNAVLALFLAEAFGFSNSVIGLIFALNPIAYSFGAFCSGRGIKYLRKPALVLIGLLLGAIGYLPMGLFVVCGVPELFGIVITGLIINAMGLAVAYVPLIPFMVDLAVMEYRFPHDDLLTDALSAAY
jgi:hypothetical protein